MSGEALSPACMKCEAVTGKSTCFPGPCVFFHERHTPGTKAHDIATLDRIRRGSREPVYVSAGYVHHGKQVLTNGGNLPGFGVADAITEEMARRIAEAMNGWLPIETAPRDGTEILAAIELRSTNGKAWWERHVIAAGDGMNGLNLDFDHGWDFDDYSHWQPLPAPPIPADASTPSAGDPARNATRSVPGVGGS